MGKILVAGTSCVKQKRKKCIFDPYSPLTFFSIIIYASVKVIFLSVYRKTVLGKIDNIYSMESLLESRNRLHPDKTRNTVQFII